MTAPSHDLSAEDLDLVVRLATRTLILLETEYPNSLRLDLRTPVTGPITPRSLHPCFHGCYDWHSAVHSVWQVVRAMRVSADPVLQASATEVVDRLLRPEHVAVEMDWVGDRPGFEMPYGMAWVLRLAAELATWNDDRARRWSDAIAPLADHAAARFDNLVERIAVPIRGGMHNQTAFSMGLVWDSVDDGRREPVARAALRLYGDDRSVDLRHEPSAADFLSPALAEADLMRRVMDPDWFSKWLDVFFGDGVGLLRPVTVVDPSDGQLAHWAGLNLSRSWMMRSIASDVPDDHRLREALLAGATAHREVGLALADHDDYMISHWVPTFAVHLLTNANSSPSS